MKFTLAITTALILIFPSLGFSGIHEKISRCQSRGGGSCIYSILHELAGRSDDDGGNNNAPAPNKCSCDTREWSPGSKCDGINDHEYLLKRDGRVVKTKCYKTKDKAYVNCIKESNKNSACR